jgi:hypothetical protein
VTEWRPVFVGLALIALVGGGFRALLLVWALRTGNAHPPDRARIAAVVFGVIALVGAIALIPLRSKS